MGRYLPALGCCRQVALHCERGQGVQLALVNYLGMVRAEAGRLINRNLVSERRPTRRHSGPSPLPRAAPIACSSAIDISSLQGCSWVRSAATLHFLPSTQQTMAFSFQAFHYSTHLIPNLYKRKNHHNALISCQLMLVVCLRARAVTSTLVFFLFVCPSSERSWFLAAGTGMLKDLFHSAISWRGMSHLGGFLQITFFRPIYR